MTIPHGSVFVNAKHQNIIDNAIAIDVDGIRRMSMTCRELVHVLLSRLAAGVRFGRRLENDGWGP
jgi:hypothetical protein